MLKAFLFKDFIKTNDKNIGPLRLFPNLKTKKNKKQPLLTQINNPDFRFFPPSEEARVSKGKKTKQTKSSIQRLKKQAFVVRSQ